MSGADSGNWQESRHGPPQGGPPQGGPPHGTPQAYPYYPPAPQGIAVVLPIPSDRLGPYFKGPLRMRLCMLWSNLTRYQHPPNEAAHLSVYRSTDWCRFLIDFTMPLIIWLRTGPNMTEEEIQNVARGEERRADMLRRLYSRNLGWRLPARLLSVAGFWMGTWFLMGWFAERHFEAMTHFQSPLGEYARYLVNEGRRAASMGVNVIPHPPLPLPPPANFQPPPQYQMHFPPSKRSEGNGTAPSSTAHPEGDSNSQPDRSGVQTTWTRSA